MEKLKYILVAMETFIDNTSCLGKLLGEIIHERFFLISICTVNGHFMSFYYFE